MNLYHFLLLPTLLAIMTTIVEAYTAYTCQVNNCQSCFYFNVCGLC